MTTRTIYLIGFSGTGKSTVARLVGAQLGLPVRDLDQIIAEHSGMTVPQIFATEGETGFRARETAALRDVAQGQPCVVATGGGVPTISDNRLIMERSGWVITLEARPETLHERVLQHLQKAEPDAVRPLLQAADPLEHIRTFKHSRQPVYALADWTVHTDRLRAEQVAAEIVRAVALLEQTTRQ